MPIVILDCGRAAASILVSVLLLASARASAQTFEVLGTRALGMAGAFVAVADDATATYWNPAGLASGPIVDLTVDRQHGDAQSSLSFAVGTPPLGLSYYRIHSTSLPGPAGGAPADRQNIRSGEAGVRTLLTQHFGATLVQSLTSRIAVATTLKIVHGTAVEGQIAGQTARDALKAGAELEGAGQTTFDLDAGLLAVYGPWRAGIAGRNLKRPQFALSSAGAGDRLRLARQIRGGLAFAPRSRPEGTNGPMTVAIDFDLERATTAFGPRRELAVGGERWWFGGRLGARTGVRVNTGARDDRHRDPVLAVGVSVSPRRGFLIEGQVTRGEKPLEQAWGLAARVTF